LKTVVGSLKPAPIVMRAIGESGSVLDEQPHEFVPIGFSTGGPPGLDDALT
jgi:hypothetical protein